MTIATRANHSAPRRRRPDKPARASREYNMDEPHESTVFGTLIKLLLDVIRRTALGAVLGAAGGVVIGALLGAALGLVDGSWWEVVGTWEYCVGCGVASGTLLGVFAGIFDPRDPDPRADTDHEETHERNDHDADYLL